MRHSWIDRQDTVAWTWQCALAGVSRATVYARQKPKPIVECDEQPSCANMTCYTHP